MLTQVLQVTVDAIMRAAELIQKGGLVAFPTETVYGLGANALDDLAVAAIFAAKGRPANNPLIVHVTNTAEAIQFAGFWPESASKLAEHFWPGPLTLVVPSSPRISVLVTAGGDTVAMRVPAHPIAQALLRAAARPLAAPSANRSTGLSPTRAEHVLADLNERIPMILDGGPTPGGLESTVLDCTSVPPQLLRPGLVTLAQIELVIGTVARTAISSVMLPHKSPGIMGRHYAPKTNLELAAGSGWQEVQQWVQRGVRVGWLTFGEQAHDLDFSHGLIMPMPVSVTEYSAQLYSALRALDNVGVERVVVALPPAEDDWLAVHDRLNRASTKTVE